MPLIENSRQRKLCGRARRKQVKKIARGYTSSGVLNPVHLKLKPSWKQSQSVGRQLNAWICGKISGLSMKLSGAYSSLLTWRAACPPHLLTLPLSAPELRSPSPSESRRKKPQRPGSQRLRANDCGHTAHASPGHLLL